MKERIVVLHNIRSAQNVGAIFRTADGAGVKKIYLTGYTPAPVDRFGRANPGVAKAALGAENLVPWEQRAAIGPLLKRLKKEGVRCVAVEQAPRARSYRDVSFAGPVAFIFGNEVDGLPQAVVAAADEVIEIPMYGKKESLNVSVAAGIILFSSQ